LVISRLVISHLVISRSVISRLVICRSVRLPKTSAQFRKILYFKIYFFTKFYSDYSAGPVEAV